MAGDEAHRNSRHSALMASTRSAPGGAKVCPCSTAVIRGGAHPVDICEQPDNGPISDGRHRTRHTAGRDGVRWYPCTGHTTQAPSPLPMVTLLDPNSGPMLCVDTTAVTASLPDCRWPPGPARGSQRQHRCTPGDIADAVAGTAQRISTTHSAQPNPAARQADRDLIGSNRRAVQMNSLAAPIVQRYSQPPVSRYRSL